MSNQMPFETHIDLITGHMSACERHFTRRASDMAGYFEADLDDLAGDGNDPLIYESDHMDWVVTMRDGRIVGFTGREKRAVSGGVCVLRNGRSPASV